MSGTFTAACIQNEAGPEMRPSIDAAAALVRAAAAEGAHC